MKNGVKNIQTTGYNGARTVYQVRCFKLHNWDHTNKRNAPPPPPPLFDSNSDGKNENQPPGGDNQQLMSATELGEHLDQEETQVEKFLSGKKLYLTGTFFDMYINFFTSIIDNFQKEKLSGH